LGEVQGPWTPSAARSRLAEMGPVPELWGTPEWPKESAGGHRRKAVTFIMYSVPLFLRCHLWPKIIIVLTPSRGGDYIPITVVTVCCHNCPVSLLVVHFFLFLIYKLNFIIGMCRQEKQCIAFNCLPSQTPTHSGSWNEFLLIMRGGEYLLIFPYFY
jgi:hypothetical protein